ncbi:MAG: HU family DNA-binding protein [Proteobacteria bacterium]|nr:HU family DNA-binding protein [Pseudomonadota bacterium]
MSHKLGARRSITRSDLAKAISRDLGLSANNSHIIVDSIIGALIQGLLAQNQVRVRDFGRFYIAQRKARLSYNPKTLTNNIVRAKQAARFKAYPALKKRIDDNIRAGISNK